MSRRKERVAQALRREAGQIISEGLRDPRIGFVTVTKATISDDLRNATVYYSVLGGEKAKDRAKHGLKSAHNFIRGLIGDRLKLRYTPQVSFKYDDSWEKQQEIEGTFQKLKDASSYDNEEAPSQEGTSGEEDGNQKEKADASESMSSEDEKDNI